MQEILQALSVIFGFGLRAGWIDIWAVALLFYYFIECLHLIFKYSPISKYFSDDFRKTLLWVGFILLFAAINQGQASRIIQEIGIYWVFGFLYLFGSWVGWSILSIISTYIVRLFFPLFKWIHSKAQ